MNRAATPSRFTTTVDRLFMALSSRVRVDGLWVGALDGKADLSVLIEALGLIKAHDPLRYRHLMRDLHRVWTAPLPGRIGEYFEPTGTCKVDSGFIRRTSAGAVALVIVHEATHARLRRFGYPAALRQRLEAACIRRERAFARMLPNGEELVCWVEGRLADPAHLSAGNLEKLRREGEREAAREVGLPAWVVDAAHRFWDRRERA